MSIESTATMSSSNGQSHEAAVCFHESSQSNESEPTVDRESAEAFFARMWERAAEAVQQKLAEERVTANEAESTEESTERSTTK